MRRPTRRTRRDRSRRQFLPAFLSLEARQLLSLGDPWTVPATPADPVAQAVSDGSIAVSWARPAEATLFGQAEPSSYTVHPYSQPIELGVRFYADTPGVVTGVRFYKGVGNTGEHVGHLWDGAGNLLATAIFGAETDTGWQAVRFATPVTIAPDTIYVASYYAPDAHFGYEMSTFAEPYDNAPLHAPAGLNQVFHYGSGFPTDYYESSNYYVDVAFEPTPGYRVERSGDGGTSWATVGTVAAGSPTPTSFTDAGLTEATSYTYRVVATDVHGGSAPSAPAAATTPPKAPGNLRTTTVSAEQILLAWDDQSGAEESFQVEEAPEATGPWRVIGQVAANTTTFRVPGPIAGLARTYFRVRAVDDASGASAATPALAITTEFPARPTAVTAQAVSDAAITVSWDAPSEQTLLEALTPTDYLAYPSSQAVEIGLRFYVDTPGVVTGVRFYKGEGNNGTHVGHLWNDSNCQLLATATFRDETETGWQTVRFTEPVAISPGTTYIASYFAPQGHWSVDLGYFAAPRERGAVHAADGVNQVFAYGGGFPLDFYERTNYFADVLFEPTPGYRVERSGDGGTSWAMVGTVTAGSPTPTSFTDTGLTEATSYAYRVIATNPAGDSAPSATPSAVTNLASPSGLTVTPVSGSQINLSWINRSAAAATNYVEESTDGTNWTQIGSVPAGTATFTAAGPFNGATTYSFRVRAYAYSYITYSAVYSFYTTASVTTPAYPYAPAINWVTPQSSTAVALAWTDAPGATGFRVERSGDGGIIWATVATLAAGVTAYTDTGLAEATAYTYRVVATNDQGDSAPSGTLAAATPPGAPTDLAAVVVSGGEVNLTWTDHSSAAVSYSIEQSTNGTSWSQVGSVSGTGATHYTASGPFAPSITYSFRVRAYAYTGGNSAYAAASVLTPAFPSQPTLSAATAQSDSVVTLAWGDVTGATGFRVDRSVNNGSTWVPAGTVATGVTSFTDTGLAESTSYTYRVSATNAAGASAPSTTRSVATPPSAPTGLTATVVSGGQINLNWTDHSAAAVSYTIQQSTDGTTWTSVGSASGAAANSYTTPGPFAPSTSYCFRVFAYSYTGGNSAYATASATTPAFPGQPTLTSAVAQLDSAVALAWTDVTGATGFHVDRSGDGGINWATVATLAAGVTAYTDTGLPEATSYSYRVVATNAAGGSAPSSTQSVVTPPSAPTDLAVSIVSPTQANLSWTDHSSAAYCYYVEQSADGVSWAQIATLYGGTATSYAAPGPFNGSVTYSFRVRASGYSGGYSTYATASVLTPAFPSQPTLSSATAQSDSAVTLVWGDVTGATGFRVDRSVNNGSTWVPAGTVATGVMTFTDTGLTEATSYTYRVVATNAVGNSAPSATRAVTTFLSAPTGLTASAVSGGRIDLSWTDHSSVASYYYVEQSTNGTTWQQVGWVSGTTATSYTATGPFAGATTYFFRVRASNLYGGTYPNYAATASVTTPAFPTQPTLNAVTAQSDTTITLTWTDVAGESGFLIDRSANNGSTWVPAGTVAAGVMTFTDTGLTEATWYMYRVVATNAAGTSAPSATRSVATPPSAPTGLTATVVSGGQVNLSWTDHSTAAAYYYVEQSPNGTADWTQMAMLSGSGTTGYTATGPFNAATTYYFRVHAYAYTGGNSTDATAAVTTPAFPSQPTLNAVAAQSDTAIGLTWTAVAEATGYRVERSADYGATWPTANNVGADVTSYTDSGLTEATSYTYRVVATNAAGISAPSLPRFVTTLPAAPTGLAAVAVSPTQVNLTWTDHSASASYYYIEQSADGVTWTQVGSVYGTTATSYTVSGPFNGATTYSFRVRASSSSGLYSAYSPAASVTTPAYPSQPTLNAAMAQSDTAIALSWTDVPGETGFRVERSTSGNGSWTALALLGAGVTSYTDAGLREGLTFTYRVVATNALGDSAPSAPRTAQTLLADPTSLSATAVAWNQINLTWTDHSALATSYSVEQSADGMTWQPIATLSGSEVNSYIAPGPFDGSTTYYFRVRAYGNPVGYSAYSPTLGVTTPAFPNRPTGLAATPASNTAINVTWADLPNETGYRLERSPDGTTWTIVANLPANTTTYADSGLTEAKAYYYRLTASNAVGDSASVVASGATLPAAPGALTITPVDGSKIAITWADRSSGESGYRIEQAASASGPWKILATLSANSTSYAATGLFLGSTAYYFRVVATTPTNSSAPSSGSATTPAWPAMPGNLSVHRASATRNDLTWSPSVGATSYTVFRSVLGSGTWTPVGTVVDGSIASYSDTGVTDGQNYAYQVQANNDSGSSAFTVPQYPRSNSAMRGNYGFSSYYSLAANDDLYTDLVDIGFTLVFGGQRYDQLYVNNNGNVTFTGQLGTYTPFDLTTTGMPIIAPFFADVDTRNGGGTVTYGTDTVDGRAAFGINWNYVGYYNVQKDKTNSFQLVLIERSDLSPGAFQIEFNYDQITWETGSASGGRGGFGGTSARAGWNSGGSDGWEIEGSGDHSGLLDSNAQTSLSGHSFRSDVTGRYTWVLVPDHHDVSAQIDTDAGQVFSGVVAGFDDPANPDGSPGAYSATIDWGDGASSTGMVTTGENWFNVSGSHAYPATGWYAITVIISMPGGSTRTITSSAHVTDDQFTAANPGSQSSAEGDVISLQIVAASFGGGLYYEATGLPPGLVLDPGTGLIKGTIQPGASGSYNVDLIVGNSVSTSETSFAWTVGMPQGGPTVMVSTNDEPALSELMVPGAFTISRNAGSGALTVYFQLSGTAAIDTDYMISFGGAGYVDESTGQGYVVIPSGASNAVVIIDGMYDGLVDKVVTLSLIGAGNQFGGYIGYQIPAQGGSATARPSNPAGAYTVSGNVQFDPNAPKPVRFAHVRVYEEFPPEALGQPSEPLGESYTDAQGNFSVNFSKVFRGGTNLVISVYTRSDPSQAMQTIDVWSSWTTHQKTTYVATIPSQSSPTVAVPTITITDTTDTGKAFWVYDAAVTAAHFQATLPGFVKGTTQIDYPAFQGIFGRPSGTPSKTLHIVSTDYNRTDTIIHEYGHAVAQGAGFFPHDIVLKGYWEHIPGSDLRVQKGWSEPILKLAFSEGWANSYSMVAQDYAGIGDGAYGRFPAELNEIRGETDEIGVMQLLWDLADPKNEATDRVELSYGGKTGAQALFKLLDDNDIMTINDLWNALVRNTSPTDVVTRTDYGALFAAHGMAVGSLGMTIGGVANNAWNAGDPRPEFQWSIPVGFGNATGGTGPLLFDFEIVIFDVTVNGYAQVYRSGKISRSNGQLTINNNRASWTPSKQDWQTILASGSTNKVFVVLGSDKHQWFGFGGTLASASTGPYWSDKFAFTVNP